MAAAHRKQNKQMKSGKLSIVYNCSLFVQIQTGIHPNDDSKFCNHFLFGETGENVLVTFREGGGPGEGATTPWYMIPPIYMFSGLDKGI